ncbi:MAG: hypothetical protein ACTSYF_07045 [Promethearchaeota archaeon]
MTTGAEACKTALDTYWDASIITKPTLYLRPKSSRGPVGNPSINRLYIQDAESLMIQASTTINAKIRQFPVQIKFWVGLKRSNMDKYLKAIVKALDSDAGSGAWWTNYHIYPQLLEGNMYEILMTTTKKEFITSWS